MSTFTKEDLITEINYNLEHCYCSEKTKRLMEIALASLEAEPVAWAHRLINKRNGVVHPWVYGSAEACPSEGDIFNIEVMPLYTAQPAPVSVLDEKQSRELFENWCSVNIERNKWHPEYYAHYPATGQWRAWQACRAAMLQEAK